MLEPYMSKDIRTVLRGQGDSNIPELPDLRELMERILEIRACRRLRFATHEILSRQYLV